SHPLVKKMSKEQLISELEEATDLRLFVIAECFRRGMSIEEVQKITKVDSWFLYKIQELVMFENKIENYDVDTLPKDILIKAKQLNFGDRYLASLLNCTEQEVRKKRLKIGLVPSYKLVDTCAGEFDAVTPYYYSTWHGQDEVESSIKKKVLIVGSGPIRIGQGIEFDYT